MKHLFLAENDYAASGSAFAHALEAVGDEAKCLVAREHEYGYPHHGEVVPEYRFTNAVNDYLDDADCVWIIQSDLPTALGGRKKPEIDLYWHGRLKGKRIVLLHGGSEYRSDPAYYKRVWGRHEDVISICYEADLMGWFEREHLVVPPLNPTWLPNYTRNWNGLRVGHFPSRPEDKGSEWIVPLLEGMGTKFEFFTSKKNVPWKVQLRRMADCDVVVDQIKPELDGKRFGEWVSIATEAAMMGRIAIANSLDTGPYADTYGRMPGIHICNTQEELLDELLRLNDLEKDELIEEQEASRRWAVECHSLKPTGEILLRLLS